MGVHEGLFAHTLESLDTRVEHNLAFQLAIGILVVVFEHDLGWPLVPGLQ